MRITILLGLCFLLTACTGQVASAETHPLTSKSPRSTTQTTVSDLLESSMPLYLWNEAQSRYEIHLIDLGTGKDVPGHTPFVVGENTQYTGSNVLSPNGEMTAVVAGNGDYCYSSGGGIACMGRAGALHIIDRKNWREVTAALPGTGWIGQISFRPDNRQVALIMSGQTSQQVMLFDTSTGTLLARQDLAFSPSLLEYTTDGKTLILYGQPLGSDPGITKPYPPRVILIDTTNLEVKWEQELPRILSGSWCIENCDQSHGEQTFSEWMPAVVISPDRHQLYIVHANDERFTTVDFNRRTVETTEIKNVQSLFERLLSLTTQIAHAKGNFNGAFKAGVISPDGTRLYVVGQTMISTLDTNGRPQEADESLGLEVIDVASGRKVASVDSQAAWIKITPDGTHLILGNWGEGQMEVLDQDTLKTVTQVSQGEVTITRSMAGQPLILASQSHDSLTKLSVFEPISFRILRSWSLTSSYAAWVSTP